MATHTQDHNHPEGTTGTSECAACSSFKLLRGSAASMHRWVVWHRLVIHEGEGEAELCCKQSRSAHLVSGQLAPLEVKGQLAYRLGTRLTTRLAEPCMHSTSEQHKATSMHSQAATEQALWC